MSDGQLVRIEWRNRVALLTIDNPPLNLLKAAVRAALLAAIRTAAASDPERIVITGAGKAFVAGADATALQHDRGRQCAEVERRRPHRRRRIRRGRDALQLAITDVASAQGVILRLAVLVVNFFFALPVHLVEWLESFFQKRFLGKLTAFILLLGFESLVAEDMCEVADCAATGM